MNMEFKRKLAIPMEVKEMYPLTGNMGRIKEERDAEIQKIFSGRSDKLLLIIGPCSADNEPCARPGTGGGKNPDRSPCVYE